MFAGFGWLLLEQGCQSIAEVQPSQPLWQNRLHFHLVFSKGKYLVFIYF
jgi:hypothetical protein